MTPRASHVMPPCAGFTLVEMAVVMVVIGLLILTVFPALQTARMASQRAATQSNLQSLMRATAAFVQANGCVPCPVPTNSISVPGGFGRVRGDTAAAACNGCAVAEGIPPFVSLGIPAGVAHDGWGRWITMRVDPALTTAALGKVYPPTAPCTAADLAAVPVTPSCVLTGASQKGLCQSGLPNASRVQIKTPAGATQTAAVLFLSHGANGYGAYQADASVNYLPNGMAGCRVNFPDIAATCLQTVPCGTPFDGSGYAKCNATGRNTFYNPDPQADYDDMMLFAGRDDLVAMLGSGACQSGAW